jgi:hypothetical protein
MLHSAAMIVAATIGLLLVVNVFMLAAGVRFSHWRHILAAYAAGLLFLTCAASAQGTSEQAIYYVLTAPIVIGLEFILLRRRSTATQTPAV